MNALFDKYLHLIASAPAESLLYLEHAPAAQIDNLLAQVLDQLQPVIAGLQAIGGAVLSATCATASSAASPATPVSAVDASVLQEALQRLTALATLAT